MKKIIAVAVMLVAFGAAKSFAEPMVKSTETVTIVSVSTEAATVMDATIPGDRNIITIQNQSTDILACVVSTTSPASISAGFEIAVSTNVGSQWTRRVARSSPDGKIFHTYCQSKGTGDFATAAVYQGGGL